MKIIQMNDRINDPLIMLFFFMIVKIVKVFTWDGISSAKVTAANSFSGLLTG